MAKGGFAGPNSEALTEYTGPTQRHRGSYILFPASHADEAASPIQTGAVASCAVLVAYDAHREKHYLGHYTHDLTPADIAADIRQKMGTRIDKLYLLPGDYDGTQNTVNHTLQALEQLRPGLSQKAQFVHFPPELYPLHQANKTIVAYQGQVYFDLNPNRFDLNGGVIPTQNRW